MADQLHRTLALVAVAMALLVAIAAAWRAWQAQPRGMASERLEAVLLIVVGVAIAGGLGMLVGGARPAESLHFFYAALALGAVPVATSLGRRASARAAALATLVGALVASVLIARLFQTG